LWAVLTAVVVTQMSVGRSLKATFDYLVGTLGGAIYGGAITVLIPHDSEIALLAVAPLALIAAINPRFQTAPITAIIVLLIPTFTRVTPIASAIDRVLEVAVGAVTGLLVSFLLFPAGAHRQVAEAAARTLYQMARALGALLAGLTQGLDIEGLHRIQDGIGRALMRLDAVGAEAEVRRQDALAYLRGASRDARQYDLVFLDPPTFSNSKRMEGVLDVGRDHPQLIDACACLLAPGGLLVFSTNAQRFRLAGELEARYQVRDVSAATVPKDFERNPHIHRCFEIRLRG